MSPEAQRIAIAEACGWRYSATASPEMKVHAIFRWIKPGNEDWHEQKLPDFLVRCVPSKLQTTETVEMLWALLMPREAA